MIHLHLEVGGRMPSDVSDPAGRIMQLNSERPATSTVQ